MKKTINYLKFLFMPHFWIMNYKYMESWDKKLNEMLDNVTHLDLEYNTISCEYLTCEINNVGVWIGNYPYAYGTNWGNQWARVRPSRITVIRLRKFIDSEIAKRQPKNCWDV